MNPLAFIPPVEILEDLVTISACSCSEFHGQGARGCKCGTLDGGGA